MMCEGLSKGDLFGSYQMCQAVENMIVIGSSITMASIVAVCLMRNQNNRPVNCCLGFTAVAGAAVALTGVYIVASVANAIIVR
jgi:hypothetical protein